jgi:NAD-dependent deacetylase
MAKSPSADIRALAGRLENAARVTVVAGAGLSAASGVPTFRGPGGLWKAFRPEELATPEAFTRDPRLVWEWYDWRRQSIARCRPNRAHEVLATWSRRFPAFALVTQNVDGLEDRAGTANVLRFHGSIWELSCSDGCRASPESWRDETAPFPALPPRCPHCGGIARPAVVWFGEPIDPGVLRASLEALDCDACLIVGTSAVVYPAAGLVLEAARRGAFTAEINPEPTEVASELDLAIAGRAEDVLDKLERLLDVDRGLRTED